ncbi:MAG: hypothetical protein KDD73_03590 [Anaerolineales bacterium]|nr:hypothetical protein [Anaerolineales bacterium]MCB9129047.1 short-chain dehydrogenase [Ardenticatenales bacterium]MCB9172466.1 short-chain dehydrogenase [Ardenticatenales bacterium]
MTLLTDPTPYRHTLIVGGTGMLAGAALQMARRSWRLTMIARTARSLQHFANRLDADHRPPTLVRANYNDVARFAAVVDEIVAAHGVPTLVVAWFHGDGAALRLAQQLAAGGTSCDFYHLLGSASANPATPLDTQRRPFDQWPALRYHQIVLGFIIESGRSRWLTNEEISAGTLYALHHQRSRHIIGTVEPWSARP